MLLKDKPEMPSPEDAEQISLAKKSSEDRPISITKARLPRPKVPFWKLPAQTWNNIGVRWKLSILLLVASELPVLIVTQTLVKASEQSTLRELRTSVKEKGSFFVSEYVLWTNNESKQDAEAIAKSIEEANLDLSDATALAAKRSILQPLLQMSGEGVDPESIKNIKLITDSNGRSIEGNALVLSDDFSKFPLLAPKDQKELVPQAYKQEIVPTNSNLSNLPIVKNAISTGNPMYGIELVKSADLQAIGLEKQANIGIRPQITQGLKESKQPAPDNSTAAKRVSSYYDTDHSILQARSTCRHQDATPAAI